MNRPDELRADGGHGHPGARSGASTDADLAIAVIEQCYANGWTDGLPVVPCTPTRLAAFLSEVDRDPGSTVLDIPHLNRRCTVQLAAINAVMAGCRPEYFPVVVAALEAAQDAGYGRGGLWQSTAGSAMAIVVNGPVRPRIGLNCAGNLYGSGFRANATIARAVRLVALNVFGLQPHGLDQSTQATPAKYGCCFGENEESSPWEPFHVSRGFAVEDSTVSVVPIRSVVHVDNRNTQDPEHLLRDIADTIARTGALVLETGNCWLVLGPEHAHKLDERGFTRADVQQFLFEHAVLPRERLAAAGKGSVDRTMRMRVPDDHPDADAADRHTGSTVAALTSPASVLVAVAGANNAGVSSIMEIVGRGRPQVGMRPVASWRSPR